MNIQKIFKFSFDFYKYKKLTIVYTLMINVEGSNNNKIFLDLLFVCFPLVFWWFVFCDELQDLIFSSPCWQFD